MEILPQLPVDLALFLSTLVLDEVDDPYLVDRVSPKVGLENLRELILAVDHSPGLHSLRNVRPVNGLETHGLNRGREAVQQNLVVVELEVPATVPRLLMADVVADIVLLLLPELLLDI